MPDPRDRRKRSRSAAPRKPLEVRAEPSTDDAHDIVYFRRHLEDDLSRGAPGRDALAAYPTSVRSKMRTVLIAVAAAPPKNFVVGGYWKAMKGDRNGWFEAVPMGHDGTITGFSACSMTQPGGETSRSSP